MQWFVIFVLFLASFGLSCCSSLPGAAAGALLHKTPKISAHIGHTNTQVGIQRDTNQIEKPIYIQNQTKDLTWRQNFIYCLLLLIAFSTPPVVPAIGRATKKGFKKLMKK